MDRRAPSRELQCRATAPLRMSTEDLHKGSPQRNSTKDLFLFSSGSGGKQALCRCLSPSSFCSALSHISNSTDRVTVRRATMETLQETPAHRGDPGAAKQVLDRTMYRAGWEEETKYADLRGVLRAKADSAKTVKVSFTGEGGQLDIFKSDSSAIRDAGDQSSRERVREGVVDHPLNTDRARVDRARWDTRQRACSCKVLDSKRDFGNCPETPREKRDEAPGTKRQLAPPRGGSSGQKESKNTDGCRRRGFGPRAPSATQDESYFITTHEIQLSELDHDVEGAPGAGSQPDTEHDTALYLRAHGGGATVCTERGRATGGLSGSRQHGSRGSTAGQIHLSITATSTAINEPGGARQEESGDGGDRATRAGDMSHHVVTGAERKAGTRRESAASAGGGPPSGQLSAGPRGRDASERSSGASSVLSDLDEADREVRSLTARAFRSLACPYLHASALVDLRCDVASSKSATSPVQTAPKADGKAIEGLSLADIKAPPAEVMLLNGYLSEVAGLQGPPGQAHPGRVTLTETLHFRCNVHAGVPEGDRRAKSARNAGGSRSAQRVKRRAPGVPGGEDSAPPRSAGASMDSAHTRAMFASSLLKNVISKKMQFEQERRMERGEIEEPAPLARTGSPCREQEGHRERSARRERGAPRRTSSLSEGASDLSPARVEEPADLADAGRAGDALTVASGTNLEPRNDAGFDTKKGAFEASRSTLLHSQNSAFRSWRDSGVEFQKESKSNRTAPGSAPSSASTPGGPHVQPDGGGGKPMKMSHLFVPSIQAMSGDRGVGGRSAGDRGDGDGGRLQVCADSTLYLTSRSPEIKISLRSVRGGTYNPFDIAKLLTPNIGAGGAGALAKTAENLKGQTPGTALKGDVGDRVPHFTVRDIRESKSKLQTPIHQVRDVRKLVKSSYHFVSLDNNEEHRASKQGPQQSPLAVSPIVIKCQSVNTNSNAKQSGNLIEVSKRRAGDNMSEAQRSSPQVPTEGAKNGERATGWASSVPVKQLNGDSSDVPVGVKIEMRAATQKQDLGDMGDRKPEPNVANRAALEKLRAAVKTMEQLYVFDRNEWKRKTEPQPIMDSHVLSLITSEEQGGPARAEPEEEETSNMDRFLRSNSGSDTERSPPITPATAQPKVDRDVQKAPQAPSRCEERDVLRSQSLQNKNVSTQSQKTPTVGGCSKTSQVYASTQAPFGAKTIPPKAIRGPLSLKISPARHTAEQREKPNGREAEKSAVAPLTPSAVPDVENYLTIPVKGHTSDAKAAAVPEPPRGQTAMYTFTTGSFQAQTASPRGQTERRGESRRRKGGGQSPESSTVAMGTGSPDIPAATIYHHALPAAMQVGQPQVVCLPTSVAPPPAVDPFQQMQRKMLLDPTTGHYYLVDTPVQPATRRLFDPETGQYVDIPMPQPPVTPLPMPLPPLALNSAAYGATYMIYPGFLPTPAVLPARTVRSQPAEGGDGAEHTGSQSSTSYLEGPYYIPTGKSQQSQHVTTRGAKPIISITSQQGPRIIAPPSFDGTTMSFVVEHR